MRHSFILHICCVDWAYESQFVNHTNSHRVMNKPMILFRMVCDQPEAFLKHTNCVFSRLLMMLFACCGAIKLQTTIFIYNNRIGLFRPLKVIDISVRCVVSYVFVFVLFPFHLINHTLLTLCTKYCWIANRARKSQLLRTIGVMWSMNLCGC